MERERNLPRFWLLRKLRRWLIRPQKEVERWRRRWHSLPFVVLPRFLNECRLLLSLVLKLKPDIVLGNARSGLPYVKTIEHRLKEWGIEVRYERLCSAWGHKLHFSLKPASSVHWLHQALAQRKRIVMVDVSRKPFSDAQRIVGGVIVWLYNEAISSLTGKTHPIEFVPSITRQMRDYLRHQTAFKEALDEVCELLKSVMVQGTQDKETSNQTQVLGVPSCLPNHQFTIPFARHLLVRNLDNFSWDEEHGCLLPVNISREAWIDDRTDKYFWLPFIAKWFI
ncbi:MAG: hypothetical protein NZ805_05640 [Armatimonadetes bacterium]|nr:hypothetical protein [Armatimonadota bacterium]MDW8028485.1 hypothetical protein [Armatimonadota bacterium]